MTSELNPYQPPTADSPAPTSAQARLYTAQQIGIAAFLGGPIAGCLLLASNYAALGRASRRVQAIVWGFVSTVLVILVGLALPKNFPNSILPVAYTSALYQYAKTMQGPDFQARLAAAGRQSTWKAVGIGVASLVVLVALVVLCFWLAGDLS